MSKLELKKEVQLNNSKKVTTAYKIRSKILKTNSEPSAEVLPNLFNGMLKTGNFPDNLKLA